MSLGMDHSWGWFCDIRNQGVESLIKVSFDLLIRSRCLRCFMSLLFCLFLIIVLDCNKVPLSLSLSLQFTFNSYSTEDDDYEGYDYSLRGKLSAVRIVFLYRFVQEVSLTGAVKN